MMLWDEAAAACCMRMLCAKCRYQSDRLDRYCSARVELCPLAGSLLRYKIVLADIFNTNYYCLQAKKGAQAVKVRAVGFASSQFGLRLSRVGLDCRLIQLFSCRMSGLRSAPRLAVYAVNGTQETTRADVSQRGPIEATRSRVSGRPSCPFAPSRLLVQARDECSLLRE